MLEDLAIRREGGKGVYGCSGTSDFFDGVEVSEALCASKTRFALRWSRMFGGNAQEPE